MNLETRIKMNDGNLIPMVGYGTIRVPDEAIVTALEVGYRYLDTASMYKYNEIGVGKAIDSKIVPRNELFVCTKLWTNDIREGRTREAFFESLKKLKTEYIDLYLIHFPAEGYVQAWKEMEKLQKEGYIKSIGVSNFRKSHMQNLLAQTTVVPAINEMEVNPGFQDIEALNFCKEHGITVIASAPLGEGRYVQMDELKSLAKKYDKSIPQVILRWLLQKGILVVPKSTKEERIIDNANLFDFTLTAEELIFIDSLNKNERSYADPDNFDF
ncbi:aldo/keto reductase [Breznakia pachnodae]|uniref:Diketogulonate reductase-like aldo/keto reductase n=1 Tax=Breznakia pachnodae TaxID=265178 RepID=A0ABU0E3K1_9FIRM|nr:aldo/keto reductase [Breznakia pachnodae]MDQ0361464.1 diketogulonate reductase-like aldo/keto reductase [Breznakia pachnodae]